jgi:hypothetical protein
MYHSFWKWQPRFLLTKTRKLKRRQNKRYKNRSPGNNNKWIGMIPVRAEAEKQVGGGIKKLPTSTARGIRAPREKSMRLPSPRGTMEK